MSTASAGDMGADADRDLLRRRASELAVPVEDHVDQGDPHIIVRAAGRQVAIPGRRVRHVAAAPAVTPVPGSPAGLVGIVAVLGELVATADLNALLDPSASPAQRRHLAVVDDGEEMLGLLVEAVDELRLFDVAASTGQTAAADGLLRGATGDVHLLDLDALLTDPRLTPTADHHRTSPARGTP